MNHLTLGIYASKNYKYNVIRDVDLQNNIEFNRTFRPGRILYVDGKRIHNGCIKESCLGEYDLIAERFFSENAELVKGSPTIPYS